MQINLPLYWIDDASNPGCKYLKLGSIQCGRVYPLSLIELSKVHVWDARGTGSFQNIKLKQVVAEREEAMRQFQTAVLAALTD